MAPTKLFNLVALASLAVMACSFGASPVNALSNDAGHGVRRAHAHDGLAQQKKKRSNSARCKPRSSSISSSSTTTSSSTSTPPPPPPPKTTTTHASQPTTTHHSSPPVTVNANSIAGDNGKACLAWPNGDGFSLDPYKTSRTGLLYSWDSQGPGSAAADGFEFMPQLWGPDGGKPEAFKAAVEAHKPRVVLGFNEPNEPGQSNMDPSTAAQLWQEYLEPLRAQGIIVGSPATSGNPNGLAWMKNFLDACNGNCHFDFIATHWYDTDFAKFQAWVEEWHSTYNLPVAVTEYACQNFNDGPQCSSDEVWALHTQARQWMDQTDWVPFYCAFGFMTNMQGVNPLNQLMNKAGNGPTDLGSAFISVN